MEPFAALPQPANWLLAPVEDFSKLGGVAVMASNSVWVCRADSRGLVPFPTITSALAQRQTKGQESLEKP